MKTMHMYSTGTYNITFKDNYDISSNLMKIQWERERDPFFKKIKAGNEITYNKINKILV